MKTTSRSPGFWSLSALLAATALGLVTSSQAFAADPIKIGVIAEEVGAVVPEIVTWESNGKDAQSVDYSRLTALLIEATKQQQAMIRAQQRQIRAEQKQIRGQQASLTQLTKEMAVIKTALHAPSSDPGVLTASRSQPASR